MRASATCDEPVSVTVVFSTPSALTIAKRVAAFSRDIQTHLASLHGRPLAELEVTEAVGGAMAILRKHHVQVDSTFTVVNLAMLVAEGVGKQLDPSFDIYSSAMPFLAEAMLRYPEGKKPVRSVPSRN